MKLGIYSVKDTKIGYMQPFYQNNEAVAVRNLSNAVNSPQLNNINQNIEDMELWQLGTFDDQTGEITSEIKFVIKAIDLKKETK